MGRLRHLLQRRLHRRLAGRKRSLFEGGVRVPFIVRWPGHTPAGKQNIATSLAAVDLLPTLCAAAGVELPAGCKPDGENLLAAFNGDGQTNEAAILGMARCREGTRLLAPAGGPEGDWNCDEIRHEPGGTLQ